MKLKLSLAAVIATILISGGVAQASNEFLAKWPWQPTTSVTITTLPLQGVHGCQPGGECLVAYDLVIANGVVVNGTAGSVTALDDTFAPYDCGPTKHLGNFVQAGGWKYGHLNALGSGVTLGTNLLQGDEVGTQGATGNVLPCCDVHDPGDPGCIDRIGVHLHWELAGASSPPAVIDGTATSSVGLSSHPNSTNSVIGEFSTFGATLRTYYVAHGGWPAIGWTTEHCPGACTLNMTSNLVWGRMQDFQHDPDGFGATFATIHVANWDTANAYRVDSLIWPAWATGGQDPLTGVIKPIGMARQDAGACPAGSVASCVLYQRFNVGYAWVNTSGQAFAAFCPDVLPLPDGGDGVIAASDAQWVFSFFQHGTYNPRADLNGDGVISGSEAQPVFAEFKAGILCRP